MKLFDLIALIFDNLNRRKGRVALTAIGVIIGTAAIVVLVSLAIGLQQSATSQLYGIGDLSHIQVYPNYGEGPVFFGPGGGSGGSGSPEVQLITDNTLQELRALPGVVMVIPRDYVMAGGQVKLNRLESWLNLSGIGLKDLSDYGVTASQGDLTLERGSIIVGSQVAIGFYDPRQRPDQPPPPPPDLFGQTLKMTMIKYDKDGNEIKKTVQLNVTGVLQEARGEPDWTVYISLEDATAYNEWFTGKRVNRNRDGYPFAIVKVADPKEAMDIYDQITAMGYMASTPQQYLEGINSFFLVIQVVFGGVGAISLLVAAIGIANTMTMAILERTREIGLMKALGATNRDVLSVFLGESAGIGLIGGIGGVLLGWAAGQMINVVAVAYLAGQAAQQGGPPPPASAVITPTWLPIFALIFATIIGLLSGLYPALRAATLIPINALKYE